jgi:hypothetical protein
MSSVSAKQSGGSTVNGVAEEPSRVLNGTCILTDGGEPSPDLIGAAAAIIAGHFDIDLASAFRLLAELSARKVRTPVNEIAERRVRWQI